MTHFQDGHLLEEPVWAVIAPFLRFFDPSVLWDPQHRHQPHPHFALLLPFRSMCLGFPYQQTSVFMHQGQALAYSQ